MGKKPVLTQALFLVAVLLVVSGCINAQSAKDQVLAGMLKGAQGVRNDVINSSGGAFSDYKVYRDGEKDGVVFEYIFSANATIDRNQLTPASVKQVLKEALANDADAKRALGLGIYARMVYKTFTGETVCEATITSADLN